MENVNVVKECLLSPITVKNVKVVEGKKKLGKIVFKRVIEVKYTELILFVWKCN